MSLKGEIAKANIFFTVGRFVSAVVAFFFSIVLARLLQPHDFGLYSFCVVIVSFFILFTDFGMKSTLTRFLSNYLSRGSHEKASALTKMIFKYKFVLTVVIAFLISVFSSEIATLAFNKPEAGSVVFFAGFVLIVNSLSKLFESLFAGVKNFIAMSSIQMLQSVFKFIFAIGFVVLGMGVSGAITGLALSYLLVVLVSSIIVYKKYGFILSRSRAKLNRNVLMTFTGWVFMSGVVGGLYAMIDQLMISGMLPIESIGFYKIAVTWMFSILYLVPVTSYVLYPYFSGARGKVELDSMLIHSMRYAAIFAFPLAFVMSAYSGPFILSLYGESFMAATGALSILAFGAIFESLYGLMLTYFIGIKRPDICTKILSVTIIVNIILNYFLIQFYGIWGAAVATLFAKFINFIALLFVAVMYKKLKFKYPVFIKPLIASLVMYFFAVSMIAAVVDLLTLILYGGLSLLVYLAIMFITGGLTKEDARYFIKILNLRKFLKK